jgi:hypothetical protein
MPGSALAIITAPSTTRIAPSVAPMKFMEPGVSMRSSAWPFQAQCPAAVVTLERRSRETGSKSSAEVPASTAPSFFRAPARYSRASPSDVLPAPACAIKPIE